ncbi:MAG: CinA family nicotinamide mononucleotide deamidase-related protein, partial [Chitinophagales bacterium]|nr:CinA family nicotinamide mononucleotide deamidase-related protein [Chitinophagales bacterium]
IMKAVIISIGDEILNGTTINTNASWIAAHIQPIGIRIHEVIAVADKKEHILSVLQQYTGRIDFIFITGGLGPTKDDITKNVLCEFFASALIFHEELYMQLKHEFEKRNIPFAESNRSQALYPHNCILIKNSLGSAQGMWFTKNNSAVISMPGVPFEMKGMMTDTILPKIKNEFLLPAIVNKHLMTSGAGESWIAKSIEEIEDNLPPHISLAYLPSPGVVKLRLTGTGMDAHVLQQEINSLAEEIKNKLGNIIYAEKTESLEAHIGKLLLQLEATISTAESCTGGKIAQKIVSVIGSSRYYAGSVIAYSYELKTALLQVRPETLTQYGAVSEQTVSEMLDGVLLNLKTEFAIAVSGIAGPDGGTPEKPVGTIYIGVGSRTEKRIKRYLFNKNRETNIEYSSVFALHEMRMLLLDCINK